MHYLNRFNFHFITFSFFKTFRLLWRCILFCCFFPFRNVHPLSFSFFFVLYRWREFFLPTCQRDRCVVVFCLKVFDNARKNVVFVRFGLMLSFSTWHFQFLEPFTFQERKKERKKRNEQRKKKKRRKERNYEGKKLNCKNVRVSKNIWN